jgi:predicted nucleic acid-binding protein
MAQKKSADRNEAFGETNEFPEGLGKKILVEADLFISYLTSDTLERHFNTLVKKARNGDLKLSCSSEVYDDIATAMMSQGIRAAQCSRFLADTKLIPHESIPVTPEIASRALEIYSEFGGRRRLHYFDSFHVSTALVQNLSLYTSDKYIVRNSKRLGVGAVDIRNLR